MTMLMDSVFMFPIPMMVSFDHCGRAILMTPLFTKCTCFVRELLVRPLLENDWKYDLESKAVTNTLTWVEMGKVAALE